VDDSSQGDGIDEAGNQSMTEDQSIAETISFSFLQKAHHPNFEHHLVPNIVIDSERFRILMYDSDHDILLCGMDLPIFYESHLNATSIVILWMVLHYQIFCSGIPDTPELETVKCNFTEVAKEKLEIYRKYLKTGVENFPTHQKVTSSVFPSYESILFGNRKW
jgi:hypothetical protein